MDGAWRTVTRAVLLAIGLFAAGTGIWLYHDGSASQVDYEHHAAEKAQGYANRAAIGRQRRCAALPQPKKFQCEEEENQTAREGAHNEYDLQSQLTASLWTRQMGVAAIIGLVVSIFGVGLVYVTFQETRRGTEEAKRSADAFIDAERPHLRVIGRGAFNDSRRPNERMVVLRVENFGQSPAVIELIVWDYLPDTRFPGDEMFKFERLFDTVLSPVEKAPFDLRLHAPESAEFVGGMIRFRSRFKAQHRAYFLFALPKNEGHAGVKALPRQKAKGWPEDA